MDDKWEVIDIDKQIRDNMETYWKYRKLGWTEEADLILKLTAHMQGLRTDIKTLIVDDGATV